MNAIHSLYLALALSLIGIGAQRVHADDATEPEVATDSVAATDSEADPSVDAKATQQPEAWKITLRPYAMHYWVKGNKDLFREQNWASDEFDGGLIFSGEGTSEDGVAWAVEGEGSAGWEEFDVTLSLSNSDGLYLHGGASRYHKYFDDQGGYFEGYDPNSFKLGEDLTMTLGSYWVEVGIEDFHGVKVNLRYDYRYKEGTKSTLERRDVSLPVDGGAKSSKNIVPATKSINEVTHIVTLDLSGKVGETNWQDRAQLEVFESDTSRQSLLDGEGTIANEGADYLQLSNALTLNRWVAPWLYMSGGYLYIQQDGSADMMLQSFPSSGSARKYWIEDMDTNVRSHVGNLNAMIGPFQDVTLTLSLQGEATSRDAWALDHPDTASSKITEYDDTSTDMLSLREGAELAYAGIPHSKVYARTSFEQAVYDLEEVQYRAGSGQRFKRETETERYMQTYRLGFTTRVLAPLNIGGYYEKRHVHNAHDHEIDEAGVGLPSNGYSAYILDQSFDRDTLSLRVSSPVTRWLTLTGRYMYVGNSVETETMALPGEALQSGDYTRHTYSVGAIVRPTDRLYLSSTVSLSQTRSMTPLIDNVAIVRYYEETWSLLNTASYTLNPKTDITASYTYGVTDSREGYNPSGIPLGVDYVSHRLTFGVNHKFSEHMEGRLNYLFAYYDEDKYEYGDYVAHGLMGSLSWTF